ncbi:MAG: hypothetical protein NTV93_16770 [Verrucomicrobia bacterium]|nr:hypothetical protein [Verrucomicrobiota bacterium]
MTFNFHLNVPSSVNSQRFQKNGSLVRFPERVRRHWGLAVVLGCVILTSSAAWSQAVVADLRKDFPVKGELYHSPELKNGWEFYVAKDGIIKPNLAMTWWVDEKVFPDGLLAAYASGSAGASQDRSHEDAILVTPGDDEQWLVARWISTVKGTVKITGWVQKTKSTPELASDTEGIDFYIRAREQDPVVTLHSDAANDTSVKDFTIEIPNVQIGDPIDLIVRGIRKNWGNETRLSAVFTSDKK